jgi:serine/threonine protein kinase
MTLHVGSKLGPYEILAPLGAGGMGEVYRGRDSRIGRDVAIKVLPQEFSQDADRLARFRREAQVLGSLNHAHIAAIYGVEETPGLTALILELVEGQTLADRIAQGPIPVEEALPIAKQIAEALETAHERGIIHRDLKPANIKLKPDGTVKVLDFGLAKSSMAAGASQSVSMWPTVTSAAITAGGVILGTAAYMSPEQARGKAVDKRADIWGFGCVLYEMLTGRKVFDAAEVTDTLAAIVRAEPDWNALPANTPEPVRRLLRRALEKNARDRLSDMADARLELRDATNAPAAASVKEPRRHIRERIVWVAGTWLLTILCVGMGWLYFDSARTPSLTYQASILAPAETTYGSTLATPASFMALSPDGRRLAFIATDRDRRAML